MSNSRGYGLGFADPGGLAQLGEPLTGAGEIFTGFLALIGLWGKKQDLKRQTEKRRTAEIQSKMVLRERVAAEAREQRIFDREDMQAAAATRAAAAAAAAKGAKKLPGWVLPAAVAAGAIIALEG